MMRGLLGHDYTHNKQSPVLVTSPRYPSELTPRSPRRIRNPLLPPSPRRGYLQPHNDLDLFTTHADSQSNQQRQQQQRQQLVQARQQEADSVPAVQCAKLKVDTDPGSQPQRKSVRGDEYRMRQAYDPWGHVLELQDRLDEQYAAQHRRLDLSKRDQLKQQLEQQMRARQLEQQQQAERKQRDRAEMQRKIEAERAEQQQERREKVAAQQRLKRELDRFGHVQQHMKALQQQRDRAQSRQWLEQGQQREAEERQRRRDKVAAEKRRWDAISAENEVHQARRAAELVKQKARDVTVMAQYAQRLEREESQRRDFLSDIQREIAQRDAVNFEVLEQRQRKLAEEEQRLVRYQQLREQALAQKDAEREGQRSRSKASYKSFLEQQMQAKQRAKLREVERLRMERVELEQQIGRQQAEQARAERDKKRLVSEYARELGQQQMDNYDKQMKSQFQLSAKERAYHKQYLEPKQKGQLAQDIIGIFPRESPARRDRKYLH